MVKVYEVSDGMLAAAGLAAGSSRTPSFRCDDHGAVLVPLADLKVPPLAPGRRGLDTERLESILEAVAAGASLPAAPAYRESDAAATTTLLDGFHRYHVARRLGYSCLPCRLVSREEAADGYRYPDGQA